MWGTARVAAPVRDGVPPSSTTSSPPAPALSCCGGMWFPEGASGCGGPGFGPVVRPVGRQCRWPGPRWRSGADSPSRGGGAGRRGQRGRIRACGLADLALQYEQLVPRSKDLDVCVPVALGSRSRSVKVLVQRGRPGAVARKVMMPRMRSPEGDGWGPRGGYDLMPVIKDLTWPDDVSAPADPGAGGISGGAGDVYAARVPWSMKKSTNQRRRKTVPTWKDRWPRSWGLGLREGGLVDCRG